MTPGSKLGPYEIVTRLGAGGMGEVWRARDARLGRDVALKVLSPVFANDPERMARFEREAQLLASLNHPNIATLHGLEESGSTRALVLELVEGPTLAERIQAGAIPLDETLPIARQIAEALEYAHDHGVMHRDLKPANIKINPEGAVKVLDFGLAKALDDDPAAGSAHNSPTLSLAATRAGTILGTAGYMSPEQAKGKPADRRADIWAYGVVLAEMLIGRQLYPGENVAEILAAVIMKDPPLDALPASTPAVIRQLLGRCLDKDPKQRLQAIGEARIILDKPLEAPQPPSPIPHPPPRPRPIPWMAATLLLALALAGVALVHFRETPPTERVLRYTIEAPDKTSLHSFAVSPDGRHVAIAASTEGKQRLWVRSLDTLQAQLLPGGDGAAYPFWSPDSRWIGFTSEGKLKKITVTGGPSQTLCDASNGRRGAWNRDGVIVFAPSFGGVLERVPAVGGVPAPATTQEGAGGHRFPVFLPDGHHFLYVVNQATAEKNGIFLASLDSPNGRRVLADISSPAFAPPQPGDKHGHILFVRESTLMALPFDLKALQPAGEVFPLAEQVSVGPVPGHAQVSVSANGVLAYHTGRGPGQGQFAWYDRAGKELGKVGTPGRHRGFALSPDEKTLALPRGDAQGGGMDIWLHDPARGADTRFTFRTPVNTNPVWSPDGNRIVFRSGRSDAPGLYLRDASGSVQEELLLRGTVATFANDWSRDGRFLVYAERRPKTNMDLMLLPMGGDRKPAPFLATEFNEMQGQFSPDGSWIAYVSDESARSEVYVRPFPSGAGMWKISITPGQQPRWRRDGKELFYLTMEGRLMAVAIKKAASSGARPVFEAATPAPLFETRVNVWPPGANVQQYQVSADGKRFLVETTGAEAAEAPLTVAVNWLAGVRK